MCPVKQFISWGMEGWRRFTVMDVALFKLCLFSIGTLVGVYFVKPLKKLAPLLWLFAAASYAYLIWRMVFVHEEE